MWASRVRFTVFDVVVADPLTVRPSLVINTITNKLVRILGKDENHRFLNISLYQGAPLKKGLQTIVSGIQKSICDC